MVVLKAVRPTVSCSSSGFDSGQGLPLPKAGFVKLPLPASSLSMGLSSGNNARLSLIQATEESVVAITNDPAALISGNSFFCNFHW